MMSRLGVGPCILMYHSIADDTDDTYSVSIDGFRKQLAWLTEHGFEVISLSTLLQLIRARDYKSLRKKVVITFDDGYKDFVINALPVLLAHRASATVFLVTDRLGGRAEWNQYGVDTQLMSEEEVRYIKEKGISLGSHTSTHANLVLLEHEDMLRQLKDSHSLLTRLGESFYTFSYPWGQWSYQVADAVKRSGYECALAVGEQTRMTTDSKYYLPRIIMRRDMDLMSFQSVLVRTGIEKELHRQYKKLRESAFWHNKKLVAALDK